jgi:hypothetical protein
MEKQKKGNIFIKLSVKLLLIGLAVVIVIALIVGGIVLSEKNTQNKLLQLEYGKPIIVTLAWSNRIYEVTKVSLQLNEIGSQIGAVIHQVSPKPDANGEITRNDYEGPPILTGSGKLYNLNAEHTEVVSYMEGGCTLLYTSTDTKGNRTTINLSEAIYNNY